MSARVTRGQLDALAAVVSGLLPEGVAVHALGHSGRMWVELLHEREDAPWHVVRTLRAGTKTQMYEYLNAMREALCLAQEGRP